MKKPIIVFFISFYTIFSQSYKIVDTGQSIFYDNQSEISTPIEGDDFYGQDAQYGGYQPSYINNGDRTVSDNITGLMWSQTPDMNGDELINEDDKLSYTEALNGASDYGLAGYNDWRLPSIKEQYSLIMFFGEDPSGYNGTSTDNLIPFIDTNFFNFGYGDTDSGERIIDAQFATSTLYVSTTMNGDNTMFGVNFADGRIKGYGTDPMPGQSEDKGYYVLYVRGNDSYGINDFNDNDDHTITDSATGLMWTQSDNEEGLLWQDAIEYAQQKNNESYLGYNDWRLPNVKELQSIVDYTRAPEITKSASIDPIFNCSVITDEGQNSNYPFFWSSTTHANMNNGGSAAYLAFGDGLGWMESPPNSGNYQLLDVHGAGCQRSDPKTGNPADYPYGHGPQGDVIRIYNYVRLVRDAETKVEIREDNNQIFSFKLNQNYPNPFNPNTTIVYELSNDSNVTIIVYDILGNEVTTLVKNFQGSGQHSINWDGTNKSNLSVSEGIYLYKLITDNYVQTKRMILLK